eukprot:m.142127 g.142127  ORF g.142127 m.142127 type:complete len:170 (+) comp22901_c0_seq1:876-1385(+)
MSLVIVKRVYKRTIIDGRNHVLLSCNQGGHTAQQLRNCTLFSSQGLDRGSAVRTLLKTIFRTNSAPQHFVCGTPIVRSTLPTSLAPTAHKETCTATTTAVRFAHGSPTHPFTKWQQSTLLVERDQFVNAASKEVKLDKYKRDFCSWFPPCKLSGKLVRLVDVLHLNFES